MEMKKSFQSPLMEHNCSSEGSEAPITAAKETSRHCSTNRTMICWIPFLDSVLESCFRFFFLQA